MTTFLIYLLALIIISLANFWLYASDKMRAKNGLWRIPEAALLGVSFFGGAIGGFSAMLAFRHKTRHWYFVAVNALGLFWQLVVAVFIAFVCI